MQPTPPLYVLGHKNPDTDAVCSAIGCAALLQAQGQANAVAARQGALRPEIAYVLERFGVPAPPLVTDVRPRVADVMTSPALTVRQETSIYEVSRLMQGEEVRAVPVVDDAGRLRGVTGIEDFARSLITGLELDDLDRMPISLENVVRTLNATVLVDAPHRVLSDRVMVGAMKIDSMLARISPDIMLVMGDRTDAQRAAIEFGVGALVITGGNPVSPDILELAREHSVTILSVPHHTYAAVRLIHLSTPVRHVMRREVVTCSPGDFVEDVAETLRTTRVRFLVVIGDDRHVVGIVSRSNLLRQVRRQVFLVDHNERGQSVAGIEEADVIGVIDHHRVADFQTRTPPYMRLEPVGATSTIVAKLFVEAGIELPRHIAGVLLSGVLADTLVFRGPTTTQEDRRIAAILSERAGVAIDELGARILSLASDVSDRSAEQILTTDFKEFSVDDMRFGVSVLETTSKAGILSRKDEMLRAMRALRSEQGYTSVLFAIIDIVSESTTILVDGYAAEVAETFGVPLEHGNTIHLPGILSRKKHLVPQLGSLAGRITS